VASGVGAPPADPEGRDIVAVIPFSGGRGGKEPDMFDAIADFLGSWYVLTALILALAGLVGLYFYLQRSKSDD
jgi:hypothetical protein